MYAVIKVVNGNYFIESEGMTKESAIVNYHQVCATMWNSADVNKACVMIVNEELFTLEDYKEIIVKNS